MNRLPLHLPRGAAANPGAQSMLTHLPCSFKRIPSSQILRSQRKEPSVLRHSHVGPRFEQW